jgi:hypothetical protein
LHLVAGHIQGVEPQVEHRVLLIDRVDHEVQLGLVLIGRIESPFEDDNLGDEHLDRFRFVGFLAEESHNPTEIIAGCCGVTAGKDTPNKILLEEFEIPTQ